jgi:hypothetical protein
VAWWGRVRARLTGAVPPEIAESLVAWAKASAQLTRLIGSGSVLSAEERSIVLVALRSFQRCPISGAVVDADLLEFAAALESRLTCIGSGPQLLVPWPDGVGWPWSGA